MKKSCSTRFPTRAVDTIEIVRGPVSALYGRGGIAGAVNYRTRQITVRPNGICGWCAGNEGFMRFDAQVDRSFDSGAGISVSATYEDFEGWREQSQRELDQHICKGNRFRSVNVAC